MVPKQLLVQRVERTCRPLLAHQGYDLLWVESVAGGRILRLYIDREGGVSLDDCGRVSRLVSDVLDSDESVDVMGNLRDAGGIDDEGENVARDMGKPDGMVKLRGAAGTHVPQGRTRPAYTLEVSSPGPDRPLSQPEHFERYVGHRVRVSTWAPVVATGAHEIVGELTVAGAGGVHVRCDDDVHALAYADIRRARLSPTPVRLPQRGGPRRPSQNEES